MSDIADLYRALDPLRPLEGSEDALYVDWQRELDPNATDTKSRLVRAFVRSASPDRPITRLLTGHKGSGKTTELNRVRRQLEEGGDGKRIFVSTLFAQRWLDLEDLQPEDLVLQIVRQLVADLADAGMPLGQKRFSEFFRSLWETTRSIRPDKAEINMQPLKFSFALHDFPTSRNEFREVLRGQLPNVFDLVNKELIPAARKHVKKKGNYDDILLIVDDLDKIPQKILGDGRVTNHENLFLDNAATLRAITCSLLLTIPIELAYSPAQGRLRDDYGASITTVPLISIADQEGNPNLVGEDAMIEILGRRARSACSGDSVETSKAAARIFADDDLLRRIVRLSGGHVRGLLVLVTELLDWVETLPITGTTVDRYVPRAAKDLARALSQSDRDLLKDLNNKGEPPENPRFWDLVRNHYVFAYESGDEEYWYGLNPLLREIRL
jgi:hypothetical protein